MIKNLLYTIFIVTMGSQMKGETPRRIINIHFVDSDHKRIPFFSGLHKNIRLNNKQIEMSSELEFLKGWIAESLLPSNSIGGGIDTPRNSNMDAFEAEEDLESLSRIDALGRDEIFNKSMGISWETLSMVSYVFPDGTVYQLTRTDLEKLGPGKHEVVVPSHLGSGEWAELGHFLVDAAFFWRCDRGNQPSLLKRCDALISRYQEQGNLEWVGNLTFLRGYWLRGDIKHLGFFGARPSEVTAEEWKELPYGNMGHFGHPQAIPLGQPIEPYRSFKKVLAVNPKDPRAIYWVKVLPWISGSSDDSLSAISSYIQSARRVYETYGGQLGDQQKVKAINTFLEAVSSQVFVQRYWKKQPNVKIEKEIEWALKEADVLVGKYPFLQNDIALNWAKIKAYLSKPDQVQRR